jgi:flagellar hook-associated protein 2
VGLRFDPMGGGQFKAALKAIIEAERQPIKSLETRKTREDAKMKLFGEFKGKFAGLDKTLQEFSSFRKFRELKVELGDGTNLMNVTVDKDVVEPGSWELSINQLAKRSSVVSNPFKSPSEPNLGVGFIVAQLSDGSSKEIYVEPKNASLQGIASVINSEQDSVVRATVVQDLTDPEQRWRLVFSAKKDGLLGSAEIPEFYFLDGHEDFYVDSSSDAQNALISIDGFEVETDGNNVKDFLKGVNVQLKSAAPDKPFTMTITEDYQKIAGKVKGLVDQLNGVLEFINKQNQVDEKSDTKTTFAGDSGLQQIEYRIRNMLHEGFPVGDPDAEGFRFVHLNQLGVEFNKAGGLEFKEEKFTKLLQNDFDGISEAITGPRGFAVQMRKVLEGYTRPGDGILAMREGGFRNRIKQIDEQIAAKEMRLQQRQQQLTDQFSRLQGSLNALQQQSAYLSSTMGGGGGNMLQQLLGG